MKTNTILFELFSTEYDSKLMESVTGRYAPTVDIKQNATYSILNGWAVITELSPVYSTVIKIPLPFTLPVNDLGSGFLNNVVIDIDTMTAKPAVCQSEKWLNDRVKSRLVSPVPTVVNELLADWSGLL